MKNKWLMPVLAMGGSFSLLAGHAAVPNDFDGDGLTDIVGYDDASGYWTIQFSNFGLWRTDDVQRVQFGFPGTVAVPGDFDGDGKSDYALYYPPQSRWFLTPSSGVGATNFALGRYGAMPVVADFDGDGRADAACYEPASGLWNIRRSRDGLWSPHYGFAGTLPVAADYDGDGRADLAVMSTSDYTWYIQKSSGGSIKTNFGGGIRHTEHYDITAPVFLDFDRDGRADLGVTYPSVYKTGFGGTAIDVLRSTAGYATCNLEGDDLIGLGCFTDTNRMEGAWQINDFDPDYRGIHLFTMSPGSNATKKLHGWLPFSSGRDVVAGMAMAQRRNWPFSGGSFFPLPSTPLIGRTASGLLVQVKIDAFSVPYGLATIRDGRGGSAPAYMNAMGDYLLLDSPGTASTGPITMVANAKDIRNQSYPTPWAIPGGFYDLPILLYAGSIPAVYRDNRGDTTITLSTYGFTIPAI